jgi:hypothetical protein
MGELMRRIVEKADRGQWRLLPECLDDSSMRQSGSRDRAFVDALDLAEMSFEGVEPARLVGRRTIPRFS